MEARGDYIGGRFHAPAGEPLTSHNPARDGAVVLETAASPERVRMACEAAANAARAWQALRFEQRVEALGRFRDALAERRDELAEAITQEMGKLRSESTLEVDGLLGRFATVEAHIRADLREGPVPGQPQEVLRYHPHGVVGVIGPFNFPLHLCHAHVVPALLLGNTVVMKPSELTPLAGERYAEAAHAAGLPPGVLNVVNGRGAEGAALASDPLVRALAFTGSWATGRRIAEALLDRPEVLVALEMGGKNACIVRSDADLRSAVHEIVTSGYLTTGQRCTCADRVLVHRSRARALADALAKVVSTLRFGDPDDGESFAGPLASEAARDRFVRALEHAKQGGAEPIVPGRTFEGGAYVGASLHMLPEGKHEIAGYTDVELFGPDLCLEVFDDDDEAIAALNATPYGFAYSVFTQDEQAFDHYFRHLETGILNLNRSTNQASPRLPFSGVKHSGNFRPAGGWAHRNFAYPVAQISNVGGGFTRHAKVVSHLPSADLDAMEERHAQEEAAESRRTLLSSPRVLQPASPAGGAMPKSAAILNRFYAGDRFVREKKPPVFDHLRSSGPWYVSIDDAPLSVLESMSQTATIPAGFAPDRLVRAYVEGELASSTANVDSTMGDAEEANAYAELLKKLVPGMPHVSFVGSGAEANEKAYALCRANAAENATKLLAFEGSFHGRTLLALYASFNPSKRVPFQISGYEVEFAPFPLWARPGEEPAEPDGWRDVCAKGDAALIEQRFGEHADALVRAEAKSLAYVARAIASGTYFAVDIEPMQSEGGDRYATARFHRGLRLLTRAHGTALIMDEVQAGFGLGGTFVWHDRFGLVGADGAPDRPDCITFAKRAQVGVCMSRWPDPEPTQAFAGSLARGRLHAELCANGSDAARVEGLVRPRLAEVERRWGHRIENPRATGYAIAFEVRDAAEMNAYLEQRFWRGAIVFGAGTRTIRYRLNSSFDERTIDQLFETIHQSLAWLEAHPKKAPPAWEDLAKTEDEKSWTYPVQIRVAKPSDAQRVLDAIMDIEKRAYEPERRDTREHLEKALVGDGVAIVAEVVEPNGARIVGSALGAPLEDVGDVPGPDRDPMRGRENTLYSIAVTVDPTFQAKGMGRALKLALLERARDMKKADGTPRYLHASGRNRLPEAGQMSRLNDSLGAYTVALLEGQYGGGGVARYYRQPLGAFVPDPAERAPREPGPIDLAGGLARPFARAPQSLEKLWQDGALFGPTVNKITVLNYITPAVARATEWAAALAPAHPHAYMCSSRDETVDKSVRVLRWHRPEGQIVIGLSGGYVGHTTACARSISDPGVHRQGPGHFAWPRVPHPSEVGAVGTIEAIRETILRAGNPSAILGIYVEPLQERTGRTAQAAFYQHLALLRRETGIPVVFVETASAYYRSGKGAFASSAIEGFTPDLSIWWTGGQLGFVHVTAPYFVPQPLTLVSTWDGDELSLVQMHHQLRAARGADIGAGSKALDEALSKVRSSGLGLYRVIDAGDRAESLAASLRERGIRVRALPNGRIPIAPRLDTAVEDAKALGAALAQML
jgi:RHH-type proline utilization regulon transcriptional repressor/proline dehydrogenase/delta 1-pyrroline-5-carboxylate dehydrogenase